MGRKRAVSIWRISKRKGRHPDDDGLFYCRLFAFQYPDICTAQPIFLIFTQLSDLFRADRLRRLVAPTVTHEVHHVRHLLIVKTPAKCWHGNRRRRAIDTRQLPAHQYDMDQ